MLPLVYHASYSRLALPSRHRFPISKYQRLFAYLCQTPFSGQFSLCSPKPANQTALASVHCPLYVAGFMHNQLDPKAMRRIGFPWSEHLLARTLHSVAGTELAARKALEHGIALHISGGYHHAHQNFGSGYCIFNDLVYSARRMINQGLADKILIIDCDVHQGDGTATMTAGDANIISCSIHCRQNFPARKADSHYDIELEKGAADDEYLSTLEQILPLLLLTHRPDLILYDAGVDVHAEDELGLLQLSLEGIFKRDMSVLRHARDATIPIACVTGGGYCKDPLQLTFRHSQLFRAATKLYR
ncbi:histone deacetylase [Shewanella chilikensis]|uniref:histone deacetylase family protein n=1 Tax=Shewanella chilikensis TaxID=558541 RepID=UPI003B67B2FC